MGSELVKKLNNRSWPDTNSGAQQWTDGVVELLQEQQATARDPDGIRVIGSTSLSRTGGPASSQLHKMLESRNQRCGEGGSIMRNQRIRGLPRCC